MARAKSPEKRQAILDAAIREIAQSGLGASTASIARGAGLAEGTLFTYFANKDELLNELYVELKSKTYRHINQGFPAKAGLRERAHHVWVRYLDWSMRYPAERKASVQLHVCSVITDATRERVGDDRLLAAETLSQVAARGAFQHLPPEFAFAAMAAMQEAVLEAAATRVRGRAALIEGGFEAFWRMVR